MSFLYLPLHLMSLLTPLPEPTEQRIDDFQMRDARGQLHCLHDFRASQLVVVVFLGVDCPLARMYGPRLAELAREYERRGVAFLALDANQHDTPSDLLRYLRDHPLPFPLLKDVGNVVADQFGAERNPEAFVLDAQRVVRYRGRIDDQYTPGLQKARPSRRDLAVALQELLEGKRVSRPLCRASGCRISRVGKPAERGDYTYTRDIAPLLRRHCQTCHRPGDIAPFSLTTYKDAVGWADTIREVVSEGRMPPWHADARYGKFANDPSLSDREKKTLFAWIDGGCPPGDGDESSPSSASANPWRIPTPDRIVTMPQPFTVPAEGTIEYQLFVVDPGFTEDQWIQAAEVRPGNRAVVHHCNVFLQPPGSDGIQFQGELSSYCLVAAASGTPPLVLTEGMAKRVPAGWRFVFVMHYTPVGSVQIDRTSLGLKFADPRTVKKEVATKLMYDLDLCIPPGVPAYRLSQTWQMNREVLLLAFFPHMHLRGKSFRYEAFYPDGASEILLDVPHYDFNWQHRYELAEPKRLPAGSRLCCTAVYDNSAKNPVNPDPTAKVRAGEQTWDEMFNGYFDVVLADEDLTRPEPSAKQAWRGVRPCFQPKVALAIVVLGGVYLTRRRLAVWLR